ncbi:hypothetical protein NMD14_15230 [Aeromonas veronii]
MAVAISCMNIFVHFDRLADVFPGGRAALWDPDFFWGYHDGRILRLGAMNDYDAAMIHGQLSEWGLQAGKDYGGFNLPWLELTNLYSEPAVQFKGETGGELIHDGNFHEFLHRGDIKKTNQLTLLIEDSRGWLLSKEPGASCYTFPTLTLSCKESPLVTIGKYIHKKTKLNVENIIRLGKLDYTDNEHYHSFYHITLPWFEHLKKRRSSRFYWWDGKQQTDIDWRVLDAHRGMNSD